MGQIEHASGKIADIIGVIDGSEPCRGRYAT
ncbi:hypothetical protein B0G80_7752 [Paraburkholderia sp. BL6669N2]|nr:hypothetical protein B0G80_7752 [Paraburkholderia sp. BL6669N2]TDY20335.1 hypothetical protein B0G81_0493 [Paraburkholderia sp. BL6665CI2N2]